MVVVLTIDNLVPFDYQRIERKLNYFFVDHEYYFNYKKVPKDTKLKVQFGERNVFNRINSGESMFEVQVFYYKDERELNLLYQNFNLEEVKQDKMPVARPQIKNLVSH
jgi:hypothetical protein